ncbi:hypothetical protein [Putridiphycobacter roseus]|nr:hypothetical protein [Putridiphycobacter roseus]
MKFILIIFCLFTYTHSYSQITIVDQNNSPIALVEICNSKQNILAKSNGKGMVKWHKIENQSLSDSIHFNHISYDSQVILRKNIKWNDTIVLNEVNIDLSEVLVSAKKIPKKQQVIDACYRSYQTNDDSLIYYTDGLVTYLTERRKINYQKQLKANRAYQNTAYNANIETKKVMVSMKLARTPPPLTEYLPTTFFKRKDLILSQGSNESRDILTKDSIKIGTVKRDSNLVTFTIDNIFKCKKRSFAKFEAIQLKCDVTLVFKVNEAIDVLSIDNFDHLVYSKIYRKYDYKHEKDKAYTAIENVEEIFVETVHLTNGIDNDSFSKSFGFPSKNNYSSSFWEACACEYYQLPPFTAFELAR